LKIDRLSLGFGHFLALFSLAVSQPIFDLLGKNVEFFLFRESTMFEIMLYTIVIGLFVPLLLFIPTSLLSRVNARLSSLLFAVWTVAFFVLFSLVLAKTLGLENSIVTIFAALFSGLFAATIYYRRGLFHRLIGYMLIIAVVAPVFFLWNSYSSLSDSAASGSGEIKISRSDIPVFVLVFDELPLSVLLDSSHNIDATRYPNFARLAATATWYRNASTIADATALAIPAILTGNKPTPTQDGAEVASTAVNYPRTLFSMLHSTHNIEASETITKLCPARICAPEKSRNISRASQLLSAGADTAVVYLHLVSPEIFAQYLPPISSNWGGFVGGSQTFSWDGMFYSEEQVDEAVASISTATLNDFHYIHMNMPHHPWIHYASGKRYRSSYFANNLNPLGVDWYYANGHLWGVDEDALAVSRQRQSLQVAYSDKLLGRFLDAIEKSGHFEDALIFVLADHGSNIAKGELFRWATPDNVADLMSIPLIVKYPKQAQPEENDLNAESVDVLPTIADVLGVEHNWPITGHTLRQLEQKPAKSKTIMRTIPSTSTDENKAVTRLITVDNIDIFGRTWRNDFVAVPSQSESIYLYDRSYDPNWLGVSTTALKTRLSERVVRIQEPDRFKKVDLSKQFLFGYLRLEIVKAFESEEFMLAIALNGTIHVTRYVSATNTGEIEAILPEEAFVSGNNRLDIYLVDKPGTDAIFEKLTVQNQSNRK
jgi:hypothetical protein